MPAGYSTTPGFKGKVQAAEYGDPGGLSPDVGCLDAGVRLPRCGHQDHGYVRHRPDRQQQPAEVRLREHGDRRVHGDGHRALHAELVPGQTYYYNIRNWSPYANGGSGGISCTGPSGHCDIIVSHNTP